MNVIYTDARKKHNVLLTKINNKETKYYDVSAEPNNSALSFCAGLGLLEKQKNCMLKTIEHLSRRKKNKKKHSRYLVGRSNFGVGVGFLAGTWISSFEILKEFQIDNKLLLSAYFQNPTRTHFWVSAAVWCLW